VLSVLEKLEPYDSLYLSPHAEDAAISCAGGILEERERGLRVLVVTLFGGEPPGADLLPTRLLGAHQVFLGLPEAAACQPNGSTFESVFYGSRDGEAIVGEAAHLLGEIARRVQPRHVYAPLAVWSHVDHRVVHDAARRTFTPHADRDVFFYEDRPYGLLPGAVKIRLSQLGARLPPGAAAFTDDGGLARFVLSYRFDAYVRQHFESWRDSVRCTRLAIRQWRESRRWRPLKAYGVRLQPALHPVPAQAIETLKQGCERFPKGSPFGSASRLTSLVEQHARRLGQPEPVERYWLLLPSIEGAPELEHPAASTAAAS
jgi:LmbE family N-acetylglucosaminyl deacetylase